MLLHINTQGKRHQRFCLFLSRQLCVVVVLAATTTMTSATTSDPEDDHPTPLQKPHSSSGKELAGVLPAASEAEVVSAEGGRDAQAVVRRNLVPIPVYKAAENQQVAVVAEADLAPAAAGGHAGG